MVACLRAILAAAPVLVSTLAAAGYLAADIGSPAPTVVDLDNARLDGLLGGCGNNGCNAVLDCDPAGGGMGACTATTTCETSGDICVMIMLKSSPACGMMQDYENCSITQSGAQCATIMGGVLMDNMCTCTMSGKTCGAFTQTCTASFCTGS